MAVGGTEKSAQTLADKVPAGVLEKIARFGSGAPAGTSASSLTKTEIDVATCLHELESNPNCDIKADIAPIKLASAQEFNVGGDENKKVVVVAFSYRTFCDDVRRLQARLIGELEKKLRRHVVFHAKRHIMTNRNLKTTGMKVLPRTRTLTAVQEALLEDIVGPTEIVGRRLRVRTDGSKVYKVFLDSKDKNKENLEEKLEAFGEVYRRLTTKTAVFSFEE